MDTMASVLKKLEAKAARTYVRAMESDISWDEAHEILDHYTHLVCDAAYVSVLELSVLDGLEARFALLNDHLMEGLLTDAQEGFNHKTLAIIQARGGA